MYAWQMAEDLWQRRFLLLVDQYEREQGSSWGWKSKLAGRLGVDASTVNKMTTGARAVSKDVVTAAITRFPIDPSFFYDEALGDAPDYHDFVGTRVERDDDRGTPNAEAYLAGLDAIGKPASPEHAKRLRGIRLSTGDMPVSAFEAAHRGWLAEEAGKFVERRGEPLPAKVDEARGQRKLEGPLVKKRR